MSTPDKTDDKGMTGASGQRWEPADEGVVVEAPDQPPPGSDRPAEGEARPTPPNPMKPGVKPPEGDA